MLKSIIIPVYNQSHFTKQCLTDLSHLDSTNEIIVVNNASTDNTIEILNKFPVRVINNEKNLGFAKACNLGFIHSKGEVVIFLNNDIRVIKNGLQTWTNEIENLLTENLLVSPNGGYIDPNFNFQYETSGLKIWNYLSGWLLGGMRSTFDKLAKDLNQEGCFIEEFGTYFEDTYMSLQAKKLNIKLQLIKVPLQHIGRGTSNRMNLKDIYLNAKQKFIKKAKDEWQYML